MFEVVVPTWLKNISIVAPLKSVVYYKDDIYYLTLKADWEVKVTKPVKNSTSVRCLVECAWMEFPKGQKLTWLKGDYALFAILEKILQRSVDHA